MFVKWSSFATPKIELLLSINLLLCASSHALAAVQIMGENPKERYTNNVLNTRGVIKTVLWKTISTSVLKCLFNITSLGPALFSNNSNTGNADNRNSCINLVIDNNIIVDRYKSYNILLFKEALKINERRPTLNKRLKASKKSLLF